MFLDSRESGAWQDVWMNPCCCYIFLLLILIQHQVSLHYTLSKKDSPLGQEPALNKLRNQPFKDFTELPDNYTANDMVWIGLI